MKKNYQKMLNNLLGISSRDNAIFASSLINNFNIGSLCNEEDAQKIFKNKNFKIKISDSSSLNIINALQKTNNFQEFMKIVKINTLFLSKVSRELLEKEFFSEKQDIINKIQTYLLDTIKKWKKIQNKCLDLQRQKNSWPLYIGIMNLEFFSSQSKYKFRAPFLLKKVEIEINENKIFLKTLDETIEYNEKLLFILQKEFGFQFSDLENNDSAFVDVAISVSKALQETSFFDNNFEYNPHWKRKTQSDLESKPKISFIPGVILSIMQPGGSMLRDKMINIIKNDAIDDLLDIDPLKNIKTQVNKKFLENDSIVQISPLDFSQYKAIQGSMLDSSIIWGPPGTGKSQVISNILANLLYKNKKVIVTSQKKPALDIIQKRMGILSKYVFFGLVSDKMDKEEFYKPFRELIEKIRDFRDQKYSRELANNDVDVPKLSSPFFKKEMEYFKIVPNLEKENINNLLAVNKLKNNFLSNYYDNKDYFDYKFQNIYNFLVKDNESKDFISNVHKFTDVELAYKKMDIKKRGLFFKKYPKKFRKIEKQVKQKLNDSYKNAFKMITINDFDNLININDYLEKEEYIQENNFKNKTNDIDWLDNKLAEHFDEKIRNLKKNNPHVQKEMHKFFKACESGFRIPYKFMSIFKNIIREIYSVFVSTPHALANIIDMDTKYDYAIFDEASQMFSEEAFPFVHIAQKSIIAGDDKQMKPTHWFKTRDDAIVNEEIEEDANSLLDYAVNKGLSQSRRFMLSKNYRSKSSELMLFSSKTFYDSELDTIDNFNVSNNAIEVYNVDGTWEQQCNEIEAKKVIDYVLEHADEYKSTIILTFNQSQKDFIENEIYSFYSELQNLISKDQLKLRSLDKVQGDEAELVVISVAYDKSSKFGSTYVARPEGKNALNVAITRAISKMVVFKSVSSNDITSKSVTNKSIPIFKAWLSYLDSSFKERMNFIQKKPTNKNVDANIKPQFDSDFEVDVFEKLSKQLKVNLPIYLDTQFSIGSFWIDIVIISKKTKKIVLGIEVDGYNFHNSYEKRIKDIERQRYLEAKGYKIYRILELSWKHNYKKDIRKISQLLNN